MSGAGQSATVVRSETYDPLSYAGRFKEAVRFVRVKILEVNEANVGSVLRYFQGGFRQPDGSSDRAVVDDEHGPVATPLSGTPLRPTAGQAPVDVVAQVKLLCSVLLDLNVATPTLLCFHSTWSNVATWLRRPPTPQRRGARAAPVA